MSNLSIQRAIAVAFFLCCMTNCGPIIKSLGGLKNPKVTTLQEINAHVFRTFGSDSIIDLYTSTVWDSTEIMRIFFKSFDGSVNAFRTMDSRLMCFNNQATCGPNQVSQLVDAGPISLVQACSDSITKPMGYFGSWDSLLSATKPLNEHDSLRLSKLDDYNPTYIFVFFWSTYLLNPKKRLAEFKLLANSLKDLGNDYRYELIRINCDLREDMGLKPQQKFKVKLRKNGNRTYEFSFGTLPWSNSSNNP
ncbi:MAG: hypothetical protein OXH57_01900 [Ekhidna sp.]|nr:hypothetical protein [Ekhidna sp.]